MALKIKAEHLQKLKDGIQRLDTPAERQRYIRGDFTGSDRVRDLYKRYRWDLYWAASRGDSDFHSNLYDYLNDDHIDSALRSIVPPLEVKP